MTDRYKDPPSRPHTVLLVFTSEDTKYRLVEHGYDIYKLQKQGVDALGAESWLDMEATNSTGDLLADEVVARAPFVWRERDCRVVVRRHRINVEGRNSTGDSWVPTRFSPAEMFVLLSQVLNPRNAAMCSPLPQATQVAP